MLVLKSAYSHEIAFMDQSHEILKIALEKFMIITTQRQQRMLSLCTENGRLTQSLAKVKARSNQQQKALDKSESKVLRLKQGIQEIEGIRTKLMRDHDLLRTEISVQSAKADVLIAESAKLKAKNNRIEADCQTVVASAKNSESSLKMRHDEVYFDEQQILEDIYFYYRVTS